MICKYGEVCSTYFPCSFHVKEARLALREREAAYDPFFTPRTTIIERPVIRREVVIEDSSPGLMALAVGAGSLLGSWLGTRRSEVDITPSRKALPAKRKSKKG